MSQSPAGLNIYGIDPQYQIIVGDIVLGPDITRFIESVEYESADGVADMLKMTIANPDGVFTDKKMFQAYTEVSVAFGYGTLEHVGRVFVVRPKQVFPQDGMPKIELTGYTKDHQMMDGQGVASSKRQGGHPKKKPKRAWAKATLLDILNDKAGQYGMALDADDFSFNRQIVQPGNMSDYDMLRALSNYTGYAFWVDGDESGKWILHFKKPDDYGRIPDVQDKILTFQYSIGGISTLLEFEPEYSVRDVKTKLVVETRNARTGKAMREEIEDDLTAPDNASTGDPEEEAEAAPVSGGSVKLFFGNFSIETITNKQFESEAELRVWAKQWFRRNRENFIIGKGKTIGVETLFARQIHKLTGLGRTLDGDWYFSRVRHVLSAENGYVCDFDARRILEQPVLELPASSGFGTVIV